MGTNEYLSTLDLEQLEYARDKANELIAGKQREKKHVVWALQDDSLRLAFFHEPDYLKAVDALAKEAKDRAANVKTGRAKDFELGIVVLYVQASEYAELGIGPAPLRNDVSELDLCTKCHGRSSHGSRFNAPHLNPLS